MPLVSEVFELCSVLGESKAASNPSEAVVATSVGCNIFIGLRKHEGLGSPW